MIQIENVNMVYENNELALIKVEHVTNIDKVLRSGRGVLELTPEEFEGNESVASLKGLVKTVIIDGLNAE